MRQSTVREELGPDASIADLEADIRETRQELRDTLDALGAKLDVKAQIKNTTGQASTNVLDAASSNWREIAVVVTWAALVTLVWKKF